MKFIKEKLMWKENLISDELMYSTINIKEEKFDVNFFRGLKKIYDIADENNNDLEKAIDKTTESHLRMLTFIDEAIDKDIPENSLVAVFVNFMFDNDGNESIINEVAAIYQVNEDNFFVVRLADYTLTEFAKDFDITKLNLD